LTELTSKSEDVILSFDCVAGLIGNHKEYNYHSPSAEPVHVH